MDGLFNDTTHISMMNISIGKNWLNKKNPFEYIVPSPTSAVGTNIGIQKFVFWRIELILVKVVPKFYRIRSRNI